MNPELQLVPNAFHGKRKGPILLIVMDGVGLSDRPGNAVKEANTPTLDRLMATCPWQPLQAHGLAVGMPSDEDMGNSEVGHNALGAGRIFAQGAKLVGEAIRSRRMFDGTGWSAVVERAVAGGTLHFIGLFSDGNVHSHIDHLKAMILEAKACGVAKVAVHVLLDGRDVGETSALDYTEPFEAWLAQVDSGYGIASGGGRMQITMDRYEANWNMVAKGWATHVRGEGPRFASASDAVRGLREQHPDVIDQDLPPFVIERDGTPFAPIVDGDAVVFFNFRGDRAIEISKAFEGKVPFDRGSIPDVVYAGMMEYDGDAHIPTRYLVSPPAIDRTMGECLAGNGIFQFACSETQKYGHVTYFWNGNNSGYIDAANERYLEVPSDVLPFEQRPWMQAAQITDAVIAQLREHPEGFARINFPNGDMVGHTGVMAAARIAVEVVDLCLARLLSVITALGGICLITADHGNAEEMLELDQQGAVKLVDGRPKAKTAHTLNPVPFIIYDPAGYGRYRLADPTKGGLGNVAATVIELLGYTAPTLYLPSLLTWE